MKIKVKLKKLLKKTRCDKGFKEIEYSELINLIKRNNAILIDVRSPQEFAEGKINSAINIPLYDIKKKANNSLINKNAMIIVYCKSGERSRKACKILSSLGYNNLYNLKNGTDVINHG